MALSLQPSPAQVGLGKRVSGSRRPHYVLKQSTGIWHLKTLLATVDFGKHDVPPHEAWCEGISDPTIETCAR